MRMFGFNSSWLMFVLAYMLCKETFQRKVLDILPLALDNDMLFEIAKEFGWHSQWLEKRKSKEKEQQDNAATLFGRNVFDMWRHWTHETISDELFMDDMCDMNTHWAAKCNDNGWMHLSCWCQCQSLSINIPSFSNFLTWSWRSLAVAFLGPVQVYQCWSLTGAMLSVFMLQHEWLLPISRQFSLRLATWLKMVAMEARFMLAAEDSCFQGYVLIHQPRE